MTPAATAMLANKVRVAREGIWMHAAVQYCFVVVILIPIIRTKCEERFCDCTGAVCG